MKWRRGRIVDAGKRNVVKLLPSSPPVRGEHVLVDGQRCRVVSCRVRWDGPRWTIVRLRVLPEEES